MYSEKSSIRESILTKRLPKKSPLVIKSGAMNGMEVFDLVEQCISFSDVSPRSTYS